MRAGRVSFESGDEDAAKSKEHLEGVDPFLSPVLDPFVAVGQAPILQLNCHLDLHPSAMLRRPCIRLVAVQRLVSFNHNSMASYT